MFKANKILILFCVLTSTVIRAQTIKIEYGDSLYTNYFYHCSRDYGSDLKENLPSGHYEVYSKTESSKFKYMDAFYKDSKKDSVWTYYFPTGKVQSKFPFVAGKGNGKHVCYFENGSIDYEGYYINGSMNGVWFWYYQNGQKKSISTFLNDTKQGLQVVYFENGQIESIENFKDGVFEGACLYFYKNGKMQREVYYEKDKAKGLWKYYDEDGKLKKSQQY